MNQKEPIDYTGKKFNQLVIVKHYFSPQFGRQRVDCKCECGKETSTSLSKVILGLTKSCGSCAKKGNIRRRKAYGESAFNRLISSYQSNAKRKCKIFSLTKEVAEKLFQTNCFYCGTPPNSVFSRPKTHGEYIYNGIDRKDNDAGYVLENCVACCSRCNYLKNSLKINDFISVIRIIAEHTKDFKL